MINIEEARKRQQELIKELEAKGDPQAECLKKGFHTWMWLKGGGCQCVICEVLD